MPIPEPLRFLEPRETETRRMHALADYGLMHVKLYEDIARHGHIATTYAYPVKVDGRYVMDPSPTPKFDNPKMNDCAALQLFGAGREKRIYAIPPLHAGRLARLRGPSVRARSRTDAACALCGADDSFLDEVITDDRGGRMFVCSDTDYCEARRAPGIAAARMTPHRRRRRDVAWLSRRSSARPATEHDLPAVLALYAQPELDDGDVLADRGGARASSRASRDYPDYTLYVAEQDGAVVGTFALLIMDNLGHLGAPSGDRRGRGRSRRSCRAAASARR